MNKRLCIAAAALLIATGPAVACGVCIDDKVAAVYDHDVMQKATKAGRLVVFCELSGPYEPQALAPRGKRAAQALTGVDSKSIRTSDHLPVISFVVDPARQKPDAAVAELRQRLAQDSIVPKLLKIIPGPAL